METSFCELKGKEVINVTDGKRLGRIIDLVFDTACGKILGFVVPSYNKSWNIFKSNDDIFIPYYSVCKIGDDAILVKICVPNARPTKAKIQTQNVQSQNLPQQSSQLQSTKTQSQTQNGKKTNSQNTSEQNNLANTMSFDNEENDVSQNQNFDNYNMTENQKTQQNNQNFGGQYNENYIYEQNKNNNETNGTG